MRTKLRLATALGAIGAVLLGGSALEQPAEASYIPKTFNSRVDFHYGFTDSTDKFCITRSENLSPRTIGVRIYDIAGNYKGQFTQTGHLTRCRNLKDFGLKENSRFRFHLFNSRGDVSKGSLQQL